jgi:hypothetical protein
MEQDSPLSIVQHTLQVYTDRNPATTEAVADMAAAALASMGDAGVELAERIGYGLDSESTIRFSLAGALALQTLGNQALKPETPKAERWGAVALLGALNTSYNPVAQEVAGASYAITAAANETLHHVYSNTKDQAVQDFSQEMLKVRAKPADDLAVELLELPDRVAERVKRTEGEEVTSVDETGNYVNSDACGVGESAVMTAEQLGLDADVFNKMIWISKGVEQYTVMPVIDSGVVVAYAVDLVPLHDGLSKIARRVESIPVVAERTRTRLGVTIIRYANGGAVPGVRWGGGTTAKDVAILYSKNMSSNGGLTRTFFTPFGNHPDGLPMVGVIAVTTKKDEGDVLNILSGNKGLVRPGSLR